MPSAWRRKVFCPRLRGEEQFFQVKSGHLLQPPPLIDRKEYSGFDAAFSDDLRTFSNGGFEEFAEPRLGVLNWPFLRE